MTPRWSSDRPVETGWYWHVWPALRGGGPEWESAEVCRVVLWEGRLCVEWMGLERPNLVRSQGGWWWGPVDPPEADATLWVSGAKFGVPQGGAP